jgi:hypothetical protein
MDIDDDDDDDDEAEEENGQVRLKRATKVSPAECSPI